MYVQVIVKIPGSSYAVLEAWGMLHDHQGCSSRWLCNILKVSIYSVEPGIYTIIDLLYGSKFS